jgi:hypothetical protein
MILKMRSRERFLSPTFGSGLFMVGDKIWEPKHTHFTPHSKAP